MKYYDTTLPELKISLLSIFLFFSLGLSAQLSTQSPYSGFGIGELQSGSSSSRFGLGGVSAGWKDAYLINTSNPASYSFLHSTTFQIEGFSKYNNLSNTTATQQVNTSGLDNVNFVFKKRKSVHSFALGLKKLSSVGYQVVDSIATPDYIVNYYYEGTGNVNDASIGYAYMKRIKGFSGLLEHDPSLDSLDREKLYITRHQVSFGANLDWIFGGIANSQRTFFNTSNFMNSYVTNAIQVNDYNFTVGFQGSFNLYQKGILKRETNRKKLDFILGASYTMNKDIQLKRSTISRSNAVVISSELDHTGYFTLPSRLDLGAGLHFEKDGKIMQWGVNLIQQDWSKYKMVVGDEKISSQFAKYSTVGTGFEITPMTLDKSSNYWKMMTYRVGLRSTKTYWLINNHHIAERALTAGVSLPLLGSKSLSRFNFGMEIGTRGVTDSGLIQEKFTNLMLGFTFTPHYYNRWFVVRKYD